MASYNRQIFAGMIFLLTTAALAGTVLTALLREKMPSRVLAQIGDARRNAEQKLAAEWLQAVEKGDSRKALYAASLLIAAEEPLPRPGVDAIALGRQDGLLPLLLAPNFSKFDYCRWRDAWMLKHIAALIAKKPFPVEEILRFTLAAKAAPSGIGTLAGLIEDGCPDIYARARLFCGLAEQAGFDAKIVLLIDAKGAPEYILIAVAGDQKNWIVDLTGRRIYKDSDINSFMPPGDWPDELKSSFYGMKLMLQPSEFQDFRPANQVLNYKLRMLVPAAGIPVFGRDPALLLTEFSKNRRYGNPDKYSYWDESFSAVKNLPETAKWMTKAAAPRNPPAADKPQIRK